VPAWPKAVWSLRTPPPPPGIEKRMLMLVCRAAICANTPSNTFCPARSSLKPRCTKVFMKLPHCETPDAMVFLIAAATGLGVPAASLASRWKKVIMSRSAARPRPITFGSFAM
jgi:hypothetical protein